MNRSESMNSLAEKIANSYETRKTTIDDIVKETHETLERFHQEHQELANEVHRVLADSARERKEETASFMKELKDEIAALKKEEHEMQSNFANEQQQAHDSWKHLTGMMATKKAATKNTGRQTVKHAR